MPATSVAGIVIIVVVAVLTVTRALWCLDVRSSRTPVSDNPYPRAPLMGGGSTTHAFEDDCLRTKALVDSLLGPGRESSSLSWAHLWATQNEQARPTAPQAVRKRS